MANYKTPGVYIEEISTLPSSVAPVATAVPAFIGYTEKPTLPGTVPVPIRVTSMLDFIDQFGGPFKEYYNVDIGDPALGNSDVTVIVSSIGPAETPYSLYHQVRMFYANGGGNCYIVSIGNYDPIDETDAITIAAGITAIAIDNAALGTGLDVCEEIDEITILAIPEAISVIDINRRTLYDNMLIQCNKLQDRFAVMDVEASASSTVFNDGNDFRNDNIGADFLKYGAAYYPSLNTLIEYSYDAAKVLITDATTGVLGATWVNQTMQSIITGLDIDGVTPIPFPASGTITITNNDLIDGDTISVDGNPLVENVAFLKGIDEVATAIALAAAIDALTDISASSSGNVVTVISDLVGPLGNGVLMTYTDSSTGLAVSLSGASLEGGTDQFIDTNLYNRITKQLQKNKVTLYPCGAVAGIYASVDRDRGVWKAPANVSVNLVKEPSIAVTSAEQEDLNVDATTGKSINAIRMFTGKGSIVWGARTLAGNDNEWRYVPVRRFFNFMEESIKKATEFVIFEPNSKPTWVRTKAMIENFLSQLWRDGALAGAKPEHAFFVKIGLGETMTAIDILEGRMNIEIGVAAVRPAEFIILKFSHKLQES